MTDHPLAHLIRAAASGEFPAPDGGWRRVPPWRPGVEAVVAFTGHAVLAVGERVTDAALAKLGVDGSGGAHHPAVIAALAGGGWIDSLDGLLVGVGTAGTEPRGTGGALVPRADLAGHPRVGFAARLREDLQVLGRADLSDASVTVLARGIAGLPELSFELDLSRRGAGGGTALVRAALAAVPADELVVSACAPGNAASMRALLRAGMVPVGSIQLYVP
ncbi:N-acetyltransferase [Sporichthya sp.]|uniref:N-acetyltransferase n=1 Tax=Sporichthya sp. TaxID=65475 RepID=UPI00182E3E81|nr:N-acetyltransferase [Sporichthya sp.]MBA3742856.1 N-acetyltransferase [Sporichthya sp.]